MPSKELLIQQLRQKGNIKTDAVAAAFEKIRRENFVLPEYLTAAYGDYPLPLFAGQTISQPTTVAVMLEALELAEGMKVLEVGAGSGYNAALLGTLVGKTGKVISTEFFPRLLSFAKENLAKEKIANVTVVQAELKYGFVAEAPYDRIIVTASASSIPEELLVQLKEGGILLMPVGSTYAQKMIKVRKRNGRFEEEDLGNFVFVPLQKRH